MDTGRQGDDAWVGLMFAGRVVTAVQPWPQVFGAWAQARVPAPDQAPRVIHSHDRLPASVLAGSWLEDLIRSRRYAHVPADMTGGPTPNPYLD